MSNDRFRRLLSHVSLAVAALGLVGCQTGPERDPLPYSPHYHLVGSHSAGTKPLMLSDACATPDVTSDALYLPPGCANAVNLQMMVERESDLAHGRRTGAAMAATVARPARRLIDGNIAALPKEEENLDTTARAD